ncbi:transient receptor potential cation channel subfamily M member 8-like [Mytilus trossulus]|uniref:transient receptor potential cation channel subfamily M member 8-like n=1 Tax=Mytilus trossulus TaxID=6551 RepID=UPI003005FF8F
MSTINKRLYGVGRFVLPFSRYFGYSNGEDDSLPNAAKIWFVRKFSDPSVKLSVKINESTSYVPPESTTLLSDTESSGSNELSKRGDTASKTSVKSDFRSLEINPLYRKTDEDPVAELVKDVADVQQKENEEPTRETPIVDTSVASPISLDVIKGNPRMVLSVIGEYSKLVHGYTKKDKETLMKSFKNISIRAGRCGFLYHQRKMKWMRKIENTEEIVVKDVPPLVYRYFENDVESLPLKEHKEEQFLETNSRDYNIKLLEIESHINTSLHVKFGDESGKRVRVPVVLVVVNGDLDTLSHVAKAVQCGMSVVVTKGSGGVADLLAMCIEDIRNLRKVSPVVLNRKITEEVYTKMETAVHIIAKRYWLITIFELICDTPESLWERLTDGIIRAWSFDQEANYSLYVPSFKTIDTGVISISKFAADIDWLSKKELFGGYCLTSSEHSNERLNEIVSSAILDQTTDVIRHLKNRNINFDDRFVKDLYKKTIQMNKKKENEGHTVVDIWKNASQEAYDYLEQDTLKDHLGQTKSANDAEFQIGNRLLKWLCFSRVGMVTCCQKTRKPESKESIKKSVHGQGDSGFRFCVLSNNRIVASELWTTCNNPMLTALIASCYLKAMAKIAENWFEDSLQHNLEDHSNLFSKRAEILLDKLFKHNEAMATQALDHVSEVWEYVESPLHFGHQFGMEEFISHTSTQKDANKRLYSYRNDRTDNNDDTTNDNENNAQHPEFTAFIKHHHREKQWYKCVTAPVSRMIMDVAFFIVVLIMFSIFLMTDMSYNSISVLELIVFVWIVGDFIEEIFNLIRPEDGVCSPQRIFLHMFDIWNFMDILCDVMCIVAFIMHAVGPMEILVHTRRIYSLALFLMFLRLFNILLMFQNIGIIIIMVKEMLMDLLYYLLILVILIFAAGTVYQANIYPNHDVKPFPSGIQNWRIWTILKIPYWQVYGEPFLDILEAFDTSDNSNCTDDTTVWRNDPTAERCPTKDWITPVFAAFYMMLSNWLLLNIVIAMFSARFNSITEKSKQKWRYHRHAVVISYENRIPSPINLVVRSLGFFCYVKKYPCCTCFKHRTEGYAEKMLKKQRELAEEIIRSENGEN